jgi:ribosomal protein S18 acetylase RimI-like enzyme
MTAAPETRVRRARLDDWPSAAALLREIDDLHAALAPAYFCSGARAESEWRRLLEDGTTLVLVAERGREAAPVAEGGRGAGLSGLVVARIYDTPESPTMVPRRRGHVESLVVASGARRHGLGRRLMDGASDWARAAGAVELVLTTWAGNEEAEAFYRELGYRPLSQVLARSLAPAGAAQAAAGGRRAERDQTR